MQRSRRNILGWAVGVGAALGARSSSAGADTRLPTLADTTAKVRPAPTQIKVGPGGNFPDVGAALASIVDNSADKRYVIQIQPGQYNAFVMKPYVDVCGVSRMTTSIATSSAQPVVAASYSTLSDLRIVYSGTSGGDKAAALTRGDQVTEFVANNLEIEVTGVKGAAGARWAIGFFSGSHDATFSNIKIRTESCGIYLSAGNYRFHSTDCYLAGDAVGLPHIGLEVASGARVDWFGGRLGTGYYYDEDLHDPLQDVIGAYVPATNTGSTRVHLHGLIIFARNIDAAAGVRVNAVRAENGWVRLFGCMCQCEPSPANECKTLYAAFRTPAQPAQGDGGKIETYGSRISHFEGNVFGGGGTIGVSSYDVSHDGLVLDKYEGGLILCDASAGPFSLFLPSSMRIGDSYSFKKTDSTPNAVTISTHSNRLIDGVVARSLATQFQVLRVVASSDVYYIV
jgi:hypothetical protein